MSTPPLLPLMADGTLPPLPCLLRWLGRVAEQGVRSVRIAGLPPGNGALPDLLADAGVQALEPGHAPWAMPFRWQGWAGGQVLVGNAAAEAARPVHHGELPWSAPAGGMGDDLVDQLAMARVEDAWAARGGGTGPGAAWDRLLEAFTVAAAGGAPGLPAVSDHTAAAGTDSGAWNPLAWARRALVALPAPHGAIPRALLDQRGARHPAQLVDGPHGRGLLTSLPFGALEAVSWQPLADPVPGCHWEVSGAVIDNGRVRAELDALGQVVRLCCDGRFVDWSGPAVQPVLDGRPLSGSTTIAVLEDGPVRARVAVTRTAAHGTLHLVYAVHAHEPWLHISATWDGEAELRLDCPTMVQAAPLEVGGELCGWQIPQRATAGDGVMAPVPGLRWARLQDADRHGLAVLGTMRPLRVSASAGNLSLHVGRTLGFALGESAWPAQAGGIAQLALALATPARAGVAGSAQALRLTGDAVAAWIACPAGWRGEVLLVQPHALRGRCTLQVTAEEAVRCHLRGDTTPLRRTREGDSFEVVLGAGEVAIIRWR